MTASNQTTIPSDDPQRKLTLADAETLPHIGSHCSTGPNCCSNRVG